MTTNKLKNDRACYIVSTLYLLEIFKVKFLTFIIKYINILHSTLID